MLLLSSADFFKTIFFKIIFQEYSYSIRASKVLDPEQNRHFSVLIWVQTGCKGYQQMTKVVPYKEISNMCTKQNCFKTFLYPRMKIVKMHIVFNSYNESILSGLCEQPIKYIV